MRVRALPWHWQFFREIFDSLQFQDIVLIDKIPFYSAFLKAIVLLLRNWTAVNTKNKRNTVEKCLVLPRFEPGPPDPKSAMLAPRSKFHENC